MTLWRSATGLIALATAIAFLVVLFIVGEGRAFVLGGFIPARLTGLVDVPDAMPVLLTPLSATLLHAGPAHLGSNLLILLFCGLRLERVIGPARLLILYVVGAYGAAAVQWLFDHLTPVPMVGASGAIGALFGAFAVLFGTVRPLTHSPALNRAINVVWLLAAWTVLNLMLDFLGAMGGTLIATPAHIGGFLVGLLASGFLRGRARQTIPPQS